MAASLRGLRRDVRDAASFALAIAQELRIKPVITSGYRPRSQQASLYRKWLTWLSRNSWWSPGKALPAKVFPANPPGLSGHEYGLAWDSWVPDKDMPLWTAIREYVGFRVPENDLIHAEVPEWWNDPQVQKKLPKSA